MPPLTGLRVLELSALGPAPFAAMLLGDLGADVVRLDRPRSTGEPILGVDPLRDPIQRNKRSLTCDLKLDAGRVLARKLASKADVLLEGFRPGVLERVGLSPSDLLVANPRLVVCRLTGFGQTGPLAQVAGHDLTYLAYSGALHGLGRPGEPPQPPLNLIADYGAGSMLAVVGILAALHSRERSGRGQVVDAAMVDGVSLFTALARGLTAAGLWAQRRGENLLDGGAPFYDCYLCKDGEPIAVAPLEPRFYAVLLEKLGLLEVDYPQVDREAWKKLRAKLTEIFLSRTRDEWTAVFEGSEACVAPVLKLDEVSRHSHHVARQSFVTLAGIEQGAPAPRFSRTPLEAPRPPAEESIEDEVLRGWGAS